MDAVHVMKKHLLGNLLSGKMKRIETIQSRLWTRRYGTIGLSLARIGMGVSALYIYLVNWSYRTEIWGPHGDVSWRDFQLALHHDGPYGSFSIYSVSRSMGWFEVVYILSILVAVAWLVTGNRALAILQFVLFWSLLQRNEYVPDGGMNLESILLIFAIFASTNRWFCWGAKERRQRDLPESSEPLLRIFVHNAAYALCVFQVCLVYFMASSYKFVGSTWESGSAMGDISQLHDFSHNSLFPLLMAHPLTSFAFSWATIATQFSVVFAVFAKRRWIRELCVAAIAGMHLGIIFGMGLVSFGIVMIGCDGLLLRDADYRAAYQWIKSHRDAQTVPPIVHRADPELLAK